MQLKRTRIIADLCRVFGFGCVIVLSFLLGNQSGKEQRDLARVSIRGSPSATLSTANNKTLLAFEHGAARSQMHLSGSRRMLEELGVTKEELKQTMDLEQRERQGEFVLQNERPTVRRFLEADFRAITQARFESDKPKYDEHFRAAGLTPSVSLRLQRHVQKIHQGALEAELAVSQVLDARHKYNESLKKSLSAAAYDNYREWELSKHADQEFLLFLNSVDSAHLAKITANDRTTILRHFKESEALSIRSSRGPFDDLPELAIGKEAVLKSTVQRQNRLLGAVRKLGLAMQSEGVSDFAQISVVNYYSNRLNAYDANIRHLRTAVY